MIRVLVTGGNSQLAQDLAYNQAHVEGLQANFVTRQTLDITDLAKLRTYLTQHPIDYLLNCAAYTQVDAAEKEPTQAYAVNAIAPGYLAQLAQELGFSLWHISTDYVFDGKLPIPYQEDSLTGPLNYYGKSKLAGEENILAHNSDAYIIRTAWLYRASGNNFVTRCLAQARSNQTIYMSDDQIGCPTYAHDLAQAIWYMIKQHRQAPDRYPPGIYHYAHEGVASRYDWAWAIHHYASLKCKLLPISSKEMSTLAERPIYSVLNKTKIKQIFGLKIPHWQDGLLRCIQHLMTQ